MKEGAEKGHGEGVLWIQGKRAPGPVVGTSVSGLPPGDADWDMVGTRVLRVGEGCQSNKLPT